MCGICGSIGSEEGRLLVEKMNQMMVHRGPDSSGFLAHSRIFMGIRRLKIIDLLTGDQPIYNETNSVGVVLNGEVYNFNSLRRELEQLGHQFNTQSDTEVIVHAYEQWGIDCLNNLQGMFALALLDARDSGHPKVLLARDRFGIKPLYIWRNNRQMLFASEVRSLLASSSIPKKISIEGLYTYLAFGSVQEPLTLVEGIYSLSAASWMLVEPGQDYLSVTQGFYWEPPGGKRDAISSELRVLLGKAVESHLVSDVPLGIFLSGGLDSGALVALASQSTNTRVQTFTLGFDHWPDDEREQAKLTAKKWNTHHHCQLINQEEIIADLPFVISAMDQPTIDGINSWYVSREARRAGLTVALSGIGGDELFAGYPSFRSVPLLKKFPNSMVWLRKVLGWHNYWSGLPGSLDGRRKLAAYLSGDVVFSDPYYSVRGLFTRSQIINLLGEESKETLFSGSEEIGLWGRTVTQTLSQAEAYDEINRISWLELTQYMLSTLLRDTDMMSMAHSLEVRVPFLDHRLVELMLSIPGKVKLHRHKSKPLLADVMAGLLPEEIFVSQKRTFTFPFSVWMRQDLSKSVGSQLQNGHYSLQAFLSPQAVIQVWQDFERGITSWARPWSLYVLECWIYQNF